MVIFAQRFSWIFELYVEKDLEVTIIFPTFAAENEFNLKHI